MVFLYKRETPWTKDEYEDFKKELNEIGVKISPRKESGTYCTNWTKERVRVKYTRNDSLYESRLRKVIFTFCKYKCMYTRLL